MPPVSRALPRALPYAQITANQTGISGVADIAGLSVTFTPGARPVHVELWIAQIAQQTATGQPVIFVTDSANQEIARGVPPSLTAGASFGPIYVRRRLSILTPGTQYTIKARAQTTAGTVDVRANADAIPTVNGPAFLRVFEEQ